jgi:plasmid stability protein
MTEPRNRERKSNIELIDELHQKLRIKAALHALLVKSMRRS